MEGKRTFDPRPYVRTVQHTDPESAGHRRVYSSGCGDYIEEESIQSSTGH